MRRCIWQRYPLYLPLLRRVHHPLAAKGKIYALENQSPGPRGGTIAEGIISGDVLFDPICDWKIGLADGLVHAPDTGQVRVYPVQVLEDEVRIGLPKREGGTLHD